MKYVNSTFIKAVLILTQLLFLLTNFSYSQWTTDTSQNTQVCGSSNSQSLPKISKTTDGGCYICWFDQRNGPYNVYLQRLNNQGYPQFAANGMLISSNPQSSSLVDWYMSTDDANNAVITFTDTRNGTSINPFAYRISPSGSFLWGANGVNLTDSPAIYQPNPKIIETSDGNFVVVWIWSSTPNRIAMQKLSPAGAKMWGNDPIFLAGTGTENFTYPDPVPSDAGSFILMWSGYSGTFLNPINYKLYTQKFSPSGTPLWSANPDTVYSLGRVNGFYVPRVYSDGNNGAIYVWQDDRNSTNIPGSYVQHISSTDVKLFPINGSAGSTNGSFYHFAPTAAYMPLTGEIYMFWDEVNYPTQSMMGIYGQKFSSNGTRLWNTNGVTFKPLDNNSMEGLATLIKDSTVVVYYNEIITGGTNDVIKCFSSDRNGNLGWGGYIKTASSILSNKLKLVETMNSSGMSMLTWSDGRNDGGDIYAQNVWINGQFGNPGGIQILSNKVPDRFSLSQNYPNPFNPSTKIKFDIPIPLAKGVRGMDVKLMIYDIIGREITTLVNQQLNPGSYSITWDASSYTSGIYFYKLIAGQYNSTKKMVLVK